MIKGAAAVGTGLTTSVMVYYAAETKTEDHPITGLKFFYAKRLHDEEKRRQAGILPLALYKAAKKASARGDSESACGWYKMMTAVQPKVDELDFYKEAAEFLFQNGQVKHAVILWEYTLDDAQLSARMIQAGNKLLEMQKVDEAVDYWKKGADAKEMPVFLEKAGNACRDMKKMNKAVHYWELAAQNESHSEELLTHLAHYYLTQYKGIEKAQHFLCRAIVLKPANAILFNELGVSLYMNAITGQDNETFYKRRLQALECFTKALELDPNNEIFLKNLEIVSTLTNKAHFGYPHRKLNPISGKPTFMFDAILQELESHRTESHLNFGVGYITGNVYDDKGRYIGTTGELVPTVTATTQQHVQTELAIKDILALKMRWDVMSSKKSVNVKPLSVIPSQLRR